MSLSISVLPDDALSHMLGFLPPEDLARAKGVCRDWRVLASEKSLWDKFDLREVFPKLRVIDEAAWERYVDLELFGLGIDDATPLDKRVVIPALKALFKLDVEGDAGFTLLTLPRGLTFKKLVEIASSPKEGNPAKFRRIWDRISAELGDIPVEKTITIALSNNILNGSRNLSYGDQKRLVEGKGCEIPGVLPAATLAVLTYIMSNPSSPTRLYNDNPWTFTRCLEGTDTYTLVVGGFAPAAYTLVVGGFAPAGLYVHSSCSLFAGGDYGVGALRKF